jgi:hypothetical protein
MISNHSSALNDAKDHNDKGDDQQDMNETAHSISADQTQKPQNDQDGGDSFEHTVPFQYVDQEGRGPGATRSPSCPGDVFMTNIEHTAGIRSSKPGLSCIP